MFSQNAGGSSLCAALHLAGEDFERLKEKWLKVVVFRCICSVNLVQNGQKRSGAEEERLDRDHSGQEQVNHCVADLGFGSVHQKGHAHKKGNVDRFSENVNER